MHCLFRTFIHISPFQADVCREQESNLHALRHTLLKRTCIPFHHPGRYAILYTMKYFSALVLLFLFCFATPVRADYTKAYSDYTYNYNLYRQSYSDYQVAKSTYATYRTLTAQNDAILKLRSVLTARNQLMFVYYDLLVEKLNTTPDSTNLPCKG